MDSIKFGQYRKIFVDNEFCNEGTDQEYFDLHFNYANDDEKIDDSFVEELRRKLQEECDEKGYPAYVNIDSAREINTVLVEIHNTEYRDDAHINEALKFIDDYAVEHITNV